MKLLVKAVPLSGRQEVTKQEDGTYKVYLQSAPTNDKANMELLLILKKHFKKRVRLIGGKTSRLKRIELEE